MAQDLFPQSRKATRKVFNYDAFMSSADEHLGAVFLEIFRALPRQGPGDAASTRSAFSMASGLPDRPLILDIGCGSGTQTLALAAICNGEITAVDNSPVLLQELVHRARAAGIGDRIKTIETQMQDVHVGMGTFDLIWAEGSIYIMGFARGLKRLRPLLKDHGYLAVTEISWLKTEIPNEPKEHWTTDYAEISTIAEKLRTVEETGYKHIGHFVLPESAWWEDYYKPLEERIHALRPRYQADEIALDLMRAVEREINLYRRYSDCYGYVFYVMQKHD
jgi:cyclopropane fatty-acyl-phospholipid synthase-like methyltransferase